MDIDKICQICGRELDSTADKHHLKPKSLKGKDTLTIHRICHRKIHSVFTERELLNYFHTPERILENEEIQKFVKWVSKKPIDYYDGSKETKNKKSRRR